MTIMVRILHIGFKRILPILLFLVVGVPSSFGQTKSLQPSKVKRPVWLGLHLDKGDGKDGVVVKMVLRDAPGSSAGLKVGDRIMSLSGTPVKSRAEVKMISRGFRDGDKVPLIFRRGGAETKTSITLKTMPDPSTVVRRELMGEQAPPAKLRLFEAGETSLDNWKGKPTIIDFWATWCGPCRKSDQELRKVEKKYKDKINVVSITTESDRTVRQYLEKVAPKPGTLVQDPGHIMHDRYLVSSFPMILLLDKDHVIRGVFFGLGNGPLLDAKIEKMLSR